MPWRNAKAYPAALVAVLTDDAAERNRLLLRWQERRRQFHRRHRPETRTDLRLARELYGFAPALIQASIVTIEASGKGGRRGGIWRKARNGSTPSHTCRKRGLARPGFTT